MAVTADVGQGSAHEAERLILWSSFYLIYPFHCFLVKNIAADTIHSIGRVTNHPSPLQDLDSL